MSVQKIACIECDLLINLPVLHDAQVAHCPRCRALISAKSNNNLQYTLAFSLSAIILMIVANLFPFLIFEAQGQRQTMTLWQAAYELFIQGSEVLAFLVASFIIIIPFSVSLSMIYILVPMIFLRRLPPYILPIARSVFTLKPWCMSEIFLLGVLASLTKIATTAHIELGMSFWAYILFALFFTAALSNLNRFRFWNYLEKLRNHKHFLNKRH